MDHINTNDILIFLKSCYLTNALYNVQKRGATDDISSKIENSADNSHCNKYCLSQASLRWNCILCAICC